MSPLKYKNQINISSANIIYEAAEFLKTFDFLDFALLFGSVARGKSNAMSDIDIAIHTNRHLALMEIGHLTATLESKLKSSVDLIVLNQLYKQKSKLAFEIVSKGKLICCENEEALVEFKKYTYLYYLDTQYLRDLIDRNLRKRLKNGLFGVRTDAGKA